MFERGKKDEGFNETSANSSSALQSRQEAPSSPATGRRGEVAVIGRSIQISGDLRGNEDLRIEGDVSGTVELKEANLTIGKEGKVRADVYAKSIAVDGTTDGDLYASERIVVHANAQVRGNITSPRVAIEEGARFKGSIEMDPSAVEKALGKATQQSVAKPANDDKPAKVESKHTVKNGANASAGTAQST